MFNGVFKNRCEETLLELLKLGLLESPFISFLITFFGIMTFLLLTLETFLLIL